MTGRTTKVKIGNSYSETENILSSVPKELVLGYLLSLMFMNNFPNDVKLEIILLADDVKLSVGPFTKEITLMDLNKLSY